MVKLPAKRGIELYSMVFVPVTPEGDTFVLEVTTGSIVSKSLGKVITGFLTNLIFPFPEIAILTVIASLVFNRLVLTEDVIL